MSDPYNKLEVPVEIMFSGMGLLLALTFYAGYTCKQWVRDRIWW
jgi:hypothetical protein